MGHITIYKCPDGRDFPVEWERPEDASLTWQWEQEHAPLPATPLDIAIGLLSKPGMDRAQAEAGLPVRDIFPRSMQPNGFYYFLASPPPPIPPEEARRHQQAAEQFVAKHGEGLGVWEGYCLPRIKDACMKLQAAAEDVPVADLAELHGYANGLTFVPFGQGLRRLMEFLAAEFAAEAQGLVAVLTAGYANATLQADQALWELADIARKSPALREVITADPVPTLEALSRIAGAEAFLAAFQRYLESYGWRTEGWDVSSLTWRERPTVALAAIRRIIQDGSPSPRLISSKTARRRRGLALSLEERLPPSKRSEFRSLLAGAANWVRVKEGRAYWQLRSSGALRAALLRKGEALARLGRISQPDDVFYLLPGEIDQELQISGAASLSDPQASEQGRESLASRVKARRQERERWLDVIPPRTIGAPASSVSTGFTSAAIITTDEQEPTVIRGAAASRGVVTARARVISDLTQADKLQRGEVLVAPMTSPTWTILFGRAAAVVTDSGGVLSHPSVAAREYGIPCVVGTAVATQVLRDGMFITVDGTQGIIRIESE